MSITDSLFAYSIAAFFKAQKHLNRQRRHDMHNVHAAMRRLLAYEEPWPSKYNSHA